ncbi:MFS transporter [Streptomyces sp. UNOC14_S4]|uniref:MFS transporter n=1 Tax=Streptomyces sp. UNOC14_S4 TaxID=2872340 RepID=UPI001E62C2A3|nr:MFS transporter [Streptomyces sp. UNOC14_S4]MCC3770973.1 MFS transporter [Streptomyces sp. UNOC14_S4]
MDDADTTHSRGAGTTSPPAPGWRLRALTPVLVYIGMVVAMVSSLGAPLVPRIAAVDHVSPATAQWSLTITMLVGAVASPTMGRLGDGPRRKGVVLGAIAVVGIGSVLAALPMGIGPLLAGRALQGVGLGLIPLAIATARESLPAERSRPAVSMLSITLVAGVGLGYPVTGLLTQLFGLHAGFWLAAGISAVALAAAALVLPPTRHLPRTPLDVRGAVLLGAALAGVLLVLGEGESWGWTSPRLLGLTAVSVVLLAWWTAHELRCAHPLVDLRLVRNPVVLTTDVTAVIAGVGMYVLISLVTRYAQTPTTAGYGFGASVLVTGLILLPFSAVSVVSSKLAAVLARRLSTRAVLPVGCAVSLLAMALFYGARGSLWELFVAMAVAGLGVGCTFAAMPGLIVQSVPPHETGSAISFNQVLRCVGYSAGSALSATVLQAHTPPGATLPSADGYGTAALLGCAVWLVTIVVTVVLPARSRAAGDPRAAGQAGQALRTDDGLATPAAGSARPVPDERRLP